MLELQRQAQKITATVLAAKRAFSVTVGAQGQITELSFPTEAYRKMAPAELASVIKLTVEKARLQAAEELGELMAPVLPEGFSMTDMVQGKADISAFMPPEMPDFAAMFDGLAKEGDDA
jgi:hypothetical protein